MASRRYRVKEVARLSGVTVRTLHHYDAIGLLSPQHRPKGEPRRYSEADLLTLQQILVHRQLGLPLETIKNIVHDPNFDRRAALLARRETLQTTLEQTHAMVRAIDLALATMKGNNMTDPKQLFDGFDPSEHEAEVKQRWGNTEAYRQSAERTKGYSKQDWVRIKQELDDLMHRVAAHLRTGASPTDKASMDLAEQHRLQIDQYFYACTHAMHENLSQMYIADARFSASLDAHGDGVAEFLSASIAANCRRAETSSADA